METNRIDLLEYRGVNSTMFTGRPQGEQVRKKLNFDSVDNSSKKIILEIPTGTTSFNPSFFLGLLFDSISNLGIEEFKQKYEFDLSNVDSEFKTIINDDIEDGMRHAKNSINPNFGLESFFND